jgi:FlaA1/EpsC-like NDP-sugar epimerase
MGAPVRIIDLAERFVRAHGLEPRYAGGSSPGHRPAVDIAFTGVRPGEKLFEELSYAAEALRPTAHPGINAWVGPPARANCAAMIADLAQVRTSRDRDRVLAAIRRHIPEMARP